MPISTIELEKKLAEEVQEESVYDEVILLSQSAKEMEAKTNFNRYGTGIKTFDSVAKLRDTDRGGLGAGDLLVIAGATGNGKSTLSATISFNMLKEQGVPSLWFTYEISSFALWKIFEGMGAEEDDFLYVPANHTTGKLEWVEKKIIEAKRKCPVGLVVIDHLGFLSPFQKMNQNMSQNYSSYIGQIVRELKTLAVKEGISIILPVHMVKSANDEPSLRDIGHSGGIAQESDFVVLIARKENLRAGQDNVDYYSPFTKVTLAKNRASGKTPTWSMEMSMGKLIETERFTSKPNIYD